MAAQESRSNMQEAMALYRRQRDNAVSIIISLIFHNANIDPLYADVPISERTRKTHRSHNIRDDVIGALRASMGVTQQAIPVYYRNNAIRELRYLYSLAQGRCETKRMRLVFVGKEAAGMTCKVSSPAINVRIG
jgi:hypothetical protein